MDEVRPAPRVLALCLVALAALLAWEALAMRAYLRVESRPPSWEQVVPLQIALDYRDALPAGGWSKLLSLAPKPGSPPYPPLFHFLLRYAYASPDPAQAALWVNWFYLALLCVALFGLAWHFQPNETAVLAVVIFVGSPVVQELLYSPLPDLACTALAVAAYWALLRSEGFQRWAGSVAFGALFAVGMLHEWSFFAYLLPAAYFGLKALSRPSAAGRLPLLCAALVALAGTLPWYGLHLPALLPGLLEAWSSFSWSAWLGLGLFTYLGQMANGLGLLFFVFSIVGLCVPQFQRNWHRGWLLGAWFVSSYMVWTLFEDRQLRFLLPGLPALAVAGLGAWPRVLVWGLAVVQFFTMVNFTAGWILPITVPLPLYNLSILPSRPSAREDWKIAEILAEAEKRLDPDRPVANLTLVANDERFNPANFEWTAQVLKLPRLHVRGVDSRLCEFSQFVVLKDGRLGPEHAIKGLPEAVKVIKNPSGWFAQAYAEARRWPLPDGSTAVLYEQKRSVEPPFKWRQLGYQYYAADAFEATDLLIELGDWDPRRSAYRSAKASALEIKWGGLRMTNLRADMEGLLLVPLYAPKSNTWGDLRFVRMDALRFQSLRLNGETLRVFLERRVRGLRISEFELDGTAKLRGTFWGCSVAAEFSAEVKGSPPALHLELKELRLGANPLPSFLLKPFRSYVHPFTPTPETPFTIAAPSVTLSDGWLSVP